METAYRNGIYDRLLEIRFKIDIETLPDPAMIYKKIGECHTFIEEVEHFSIKISKEISVKQQALNNATADYEVKKNTLLTKDEIKDLPSFKDREAAVNILLHEEYAAVTEYENDVTDLNNLLKSITLKIRNLNRANKDIAMQLRVFEAQAKIGGQGSNYAVKSMLEEFQKSPLSEDVFGEAESEELEEENVVDPSADINVENLLDNKEEEKPTEEEVIENLIEPVPELNPDEDGESPVIEDSFIDPDSFKNVIEEPEPVPEKEVNLDDCFKTVEEPVQEPEQKINVDDLINSEEKTTNQKGGTQEETQIKTETKVEVAENQKESHTVKTGMDLDDLLDNFKTTK